MSKSSKARKEKLNKGFANIPVAQRNAFAKQYYAPGAWKARACKRMVEFIQNYLRVIFNSIPFNTPRINPFIKDVKSNPDGSVDYTLVYPDPPKWFSQEFIMKNDPTEPAQ